MNLAYHALLQTRTHSHAASRSCWVVAFALFSFVLSSCTLSLKQSARSIGNEQKTYVKLTNAQYAVVPGTCSRVDLSFDSSFPKDTTSNLSVSEGIASLYSDSSCTTPLSQIVGQPSGQVSVYLKANDHRAMGILIQTSGLADQVVAVPTRSQGISPVSVWGQPSLDRNLHLERGFNGPVGVAVIQGRLYVTDYHHRLLMWNSVPTVSSTVPNLIIGKNNFGLPDRNAGGITNRSFLNPYSIHSDGTRMAVADYNNRRVMIWNQIPSTDVGADVVVGAPSFKSGLGNFGGVSNKTLQGPTGVKFLAGRLVVADCSNHRVMIWNSVPSSDFAPADIILGQPSTTTNTANNGGLSASTFSCPHDVEYDGTRFYVSDMNNHRILVWNSFPSASGQAADLALGQANLTSNTANAGGLSAASLWAPEALTLQGSMLFVHDRGNTRILGYNVSSAPSMNQAAVRVLGKPNFTTNTVVNPPTASEISSYGRLATSGSKLLFADYSNNRVLIWNTISTDGQAADVVLGQPDFVSNKPSNGGVSASLSDGVYGLGSDGTRVALASATENRVLLWNSKTNYLAGSPADVILGQTTPSGRLTNAGGLSASSMSSPTDVVFYGTKMIVVDNSNHRVLIWNTIPTTTGQAADVVLGQPNFTSNTANNGGAAAGFYYPVRATIDSSGNLFVADYLNHRVLGWSGIPTSNGAAPAFAIGQPDLNTVTAGSGLNQLSRPTSVRAVGAKLLITDVGNKRVLVFNTSPTASNTSANLSFGTATNEIGLSAHSFTHPWDITTDGTRIFIADYADKRVLGWSSVPTSSTQPADWVLGRPHFLENRSFPPALDERLDVPTGIAMIGNLIAVADQSRGRVLHYDVNALSSASGTVISSSLSKPSLSSSLSEAQKAAVNGTYSSCSAVLASYASAPDGYYSLAVDPGAPTVKSQVYCLMSQGGYMEIIRGADTSLTQLSVFGDTSQITSTFYQDPMFGIGWGTNYATGGSNPWPAVQKCYRATKLGGSISRMKVKVGARDEVNPAAGGSLGYLEILKEDLGWANWAAFSPYLTSQGLLYFVDAWGSNFGIGNNATNVYPDTLQSVAQQEGQIIDRVVEVNVASNELHLCMGGESAAYNKRYVSGLWVK